MIFSDRDLRALIDSGRLVIEPFDSGAVQPSSIDLRVGNQFRVFANSRHPYIDVRQPMEGLTEMVEASDSEPFILHPGEFVLGSTLERVALPDDVVGRLEGKSSLGRLGLLIHSSLPGSEPVLFRTADGQTRWLPIQDVVRKRLTGEVVSFDPDTFDVGFHEVTGVLEGPEDRIFEVRLASGRSVRVTAGHNLFTVDSNGELAKVRTGELAPRTLVAIPRVLPDPAISEALFLDLLDLAPEPEIAGLVLEGDTVRDLFNSHGELVASLLNEWGVQHVGFYRERSRLPAVVALSFGKLPRDGLRIGVRGSWKTIPVRIPIDEDLAWLLGLYVAEGYRRDGQVCWSNTDQQILDRAEVTLDRLGLSVYRSQGAIVCCSKLLSNVIGWLGIGDGARSKRIPPLVYEWPAILVQGFLDGFVDGDGSLEEKRTSLWMSSELLVTDFLSLLARLGLRSSASFRSRGGSGLYQITVPRNEHKLLTAVPLPDRLLVAIRDDIGLTQVEAARLMGFRHATSLCNVENRQGRDAVRLATLRRVISTYGGRASPDRLSRLTRVVDGGLLWDRVIEVKDTGVWETVYDLEVRPGGRRIENFLAGRGGVFVANTAGYVDPGFKGHLTLELSNVANLPITLYPGMRIGQLSIFRMTSPAERPYGSEELGSKYVGQEGPTPSRYFENFKEEST